jgi:hypothetical protein
VAQTIRGAPLPGEVDGAPIHQLPYKARDWSCSRKLVARVEATDLGSDTRFAVRVAKLKGRIKLAFPASYPRAAMLAAMTGAITTRGP